jgi:hypothetical protein
MAEKSGWDQANRRQKLGMVWRNRKKIIQIIKDYFYLPFFLLIILCLVVTVLSSHGSVVAEMQVGQHGIHLVSPDRLRHHGVPAVHLVLPQHFSPWKWGVATMLQQGLGASKNKHKNKPNCE